MAEIADGKEFSFTSIHDFAAFTAPYGVVYFHVFDDTPSDLLCRGLRACMMDFEVLVNLKAEVNEGFLSHVAMPIRTPFIGAFTKGAFIDYIGKPEDVPRLIANARRFYGHTRKENGKENVSG